MTNPNLTPLSTTTGPMDPPTDDAFAMPPAPLAQDPAPLSDPPSFDNTFPEPDDNTISPQQQFNEQWQQELSARKAAEVRFVEKI